MRCGEVLMAERRMFTKQIIDSDAFLDMPLSAQALYFHLNMRADDDGFVNNPRRIQREIGVSEDDFRILLTKHFIIAFDNGVIVIKHWRMHNYLRKDRYHPTQYKEQFDTLYIKENGAYTTSPQQGISSQEQPRLTSGTQAVYQRCTEDRKGKESKEKDSLVEGSKAPHISDLRKQMKGE